MDGYTHIKCDHMQQEHIGKNVIKLASDNLLDLCDDCYAVLCGEILQGIMTDAMERVLKDQVRGI